MHLLPSKGSNKRPKTRLSTLSDSSESSLSCSSLTCRSDGNVLNVLWFISYIFTPKFSLYIWYLWKLRRCLAFTYQVCSCTTDWPIDQTNVQVQGLESLKVTVRSLTLVLVFAASRQCDRSSEFDPSTPPLLRERCSKMNEGGDFTKQQWENVYLRSLRLHKWQNYFGTFSLFTFCTG